jgi:small subunit ribosomal protein S1
MSLLRCAFAFRTHRPPFVMTETAATQKKPDETSPAAEEPASPATESAAETSTAPLPEQAPSPPQERDEVRLLRRAKEDGTSVEGRVIGWNNGGFHVVTEGVTAFCPRSEMELGHSKAPESYLDKEFLFRILKIQKRGRRVVLSRAAELRTEREKARTEAQQQLEPGASLTGKVASLTDFGAFIDIGGGLQGLVHVSEISRQRIERPSEVLKVGEEVEVKVLRVDKGGKRISLSIRQLQPDPWADIRKRFPPGAIVNGKVQKAESFGAFVELEPGVTGLLPTAAMSIPRETSPARAYPPGKEVRVQVVTVDPKRQRIALALEGSSVEGSRVDYQSYVRTQKTETEQGFNALADAFRKLQDKP